MGFLSVFVLILRFLDLFLKQFMVLHQRTSHMLTVCEPVWSPGPQSVGCFTVRTKTFSSSALSHWNSLLEDLRAAGSVEVFQWELKTSSAFGLNTVYRHYCTFRLLYLLIHIKKHAEWKSLCLSDVEKMVYRWEENSTCNGNRLNGLIMTHTKK